MKLMSLRSLAALTVVLTGSALFAQLPVNIGVNNDGRSADPSAILDVSSSYLPVATAQQKGMLIPRMTRAQRDAIGATVPTEQGMLIYQTDNTPGFYYMEYSNTWVRVANGANGWELLGNNVTTPANDFLGTRDNTDLVFRASNVPAMRLLGAPAGRYLGIGTTTPAEQVTVNNAIRIYAPVPGPYSATTTTPGVIMYRPDTLFATWVPPASPVQNIDALMWNGHWGQTSAVNVNNLALPDANTGGWRKLENDYEERFTKAYQQQGSPVCNTGQVAEIPQGAVTVSSAAPNPLLVTPFPFDVVTRRYRNQYLFRASELNVETAQLNGNPTQVGGLCPGSPMDQIGFYVNQAIALNNPQRVLEYVVTVKHVALGINDLTGGFDNGTDPAAGCSFAAAATHPAVGGAGWRTFNLVPAFVWDGVRNVVVEIAVRTANGAGGVTVVGGIPVRATNTGANLTYSTYSAPIYPAPCNPATGIGNCNSANIATNLPSAGCGTSGPSTWRPVIQFGGSVANATPLTAGNNSYIYYVGGLVTEASTSPNPWGRQVTPYYSFKGPGTISAENGVYDNTTRLNDHVFDRAFDGAVAPDDAATFGTQRNLSINEMAAFSRMNRHLPTIKGRDSWRTEGGFSLGDLTNQLWTTTETQALYVVELNDRLNVLELLSNDRPISPEELTLARTLLPAMPDYTDAEKAVLLHSLSERTVTTNQR